MSLRATEGKEKGPFLPSSLFGALSFLAGRKRWKGAFACGKQRRGGEKEGVRIEGRDRKKRRSGSFDSLSRTESDSRGGPNQNTLRKLLRDVWPSDFIAHRPFQHFLSQLTFS